MKIINIVGARPQFIKYFPVSKAVSDCNNSMKTSIRDVLVHTGQHYDYMMSKVFFDDFGIKEPDYHLGVGSGNQGAQTGQIMQKVEDVLIKEQPDVVVVYGDTNSTLGGAIASAKLHISVAHVEAGLRSFNKKMPEEINRILTDHVSSILFCPSRTAIKNLINEGHQHVMNEGLLISEDYWQREREESGADKDNPAVLNVGDVMYDVLLFALEIARHKLQILEALEIDSKNYYLLTMHRAENTDDLEKFAEIIDFVNATSTGMSVIFPMHPRTKSMYKNARKRFADNVTVTEPVGYFDLLMLMKNSALVMTDSGGMQKEAYWMKIPCITLRDETEWVETVESGWNVLYRDYRRAPCPSNTQTTAYGDGKGAERIGGALALLA